MLARAAPRLSMLPRRPAWHAACRASRAFSLAAQHRSPTSYLHDLVGDANQPGLLGGYGVKAVALVDVNAGEVSLSLRLSPSLSLRLSLSISLRLRLTLTRSSFARRASSCPRLRCTPSRPVLTLHHLTLTRQHRPSAYGHEPNPNPNVSNTGVARHCQIDGEGRYTAHSFSPNTAVLIAPLEAKPISFVALRPIPKVGASVLPTTH